MVQVHNCHWGPLHHWCLCWRQTVEPVPLTLIPSAQGPGNLVTSIFVDSFSGHLLFKWLWAHVLTFKYGLIIRTLYETDSNSSQTWSSGIQECVALFPTFVVASISLVFSSLYKLNHILDFQFCTYAYVFTTISLALLRPMHFSV